MQLDHVTIAGVDLARLQQGFAGCGFEPVYGGPHSNGITHMAAVSFADGSYVELISRLGPQGVSRFWPEFIAADAGPCAWCAAVDDIRKETARLAELGLPVEGPLSMQRQRPDGATVEWDLTYIGTGSPGARMPFLIQDHTPRALRVPPASPSQSRFQGIAAVLLAVRDLEASVAEFRRLWNWPEPMLQEDEFLESRIAVFSGAPVILAQPSSGDLLSRVRQWGDLPAAILLRAGEGAAHQPEFRTRAVSHWRAGERVLRLGWFSPPLLPHILLASVES